MNKFRRLIASVAAIGMMLSIIPVASASYFNDVASDNVFAPFIDHGVAQGYFSTSNESFYPNNNLSRGELAKLAVVGAGHELVENAEHDFDDVKKGDTFYDYIETLLNNLVISPNQFYRPNDSVTRGEAAKMLVNSFGYELDTTGGPTFPDVSADNAFYSYIETAVNNGLVSGYEDGTFKPNNNITRAEAAKILAMATGYTGEWGEVDGLVLKLSADSVELGDSLTFTVKVVDAAGSTVQDYEGEASFSVSTGNLSKKDVELVNGSATVNYTAPGYGAKATVKVEVDDFMAEGSFTVVVPEDQRMMLYTTDNIVDPTETAILYLTLADEAGMPINGRTADLTFDVIQGDGRVEQVSAFPGGADGVYRAIFKTVAAATGTNIIKVTDNTTNESLEMDLEIGVPNMEVYLVDSSVSVNQTTTLLVNLTSGDGAPVMGALAGSKLTASFLNSELGTFTNGTSLGAGWYAFTVNAADKTSDEAKIKVSYTGVTPNVHEYVSLEIAPYDLSLEVINNDLNTLTGVATLVVTIKDVNGNPVDVSTLDPTKDLDVDVITSAAWTDPSGNEVFGNASDWSTAFSGANGVLVTQIYACGNPAVATVTPSDCYIDDTSVTVRVRTNTAVNESVEAQVDIAFSDPIISEAQRFDNGGTDVVLVNVTDKDGNGILGLDDDGSGLTSFFKVNTTVVPTVDATSLGGGIYMLENLVAAASMKVILGNEDADFSTLGAANGDGLYYMVSDNSVSEGVDGSTARGAAVVANVSVGILTIPVPVPTITSDDSSIVVAAFAPTPTAVTGIYQSVLSAAPVDQLEVANVVIKSGDTTIKTSTISVRPIEINHTSLDLNGKVVEKIYGYVTATDGDEKLVDTGAPNNITVDTDGAVNDEEVNDTNGHIVAFGPSSIDGLYAVEFERKTGNDDANKQGMVEYQLEGDDETANIDNWKFDLVNPTFDVYVQNDTTYVVPKSKATGVVDDDNAIAILAVTREDQGVARDLSYGADGVLGTADDETVQVEVTNGDGLLDLAALSRAGGNKDKLAMQDNAFNGIYNINFLPGEDAEINSLEIYTSYDDNNDKYLLDLEVIWPTAQVVAFPLKIDPDKQNNESTILALVKDNYGNSVEGLTVLTSNSDFAVEIEGDQKLTALNNEANDDTIYYGNYSTDEVGTQEVVVKYNDDYDLMTFDIVVEMTEN